jgi:hypothetical protein
MTRAVIVRLVRDCALGRTIQYSALFRFNRLRLRLLDAPPSRGMTGQEFTSFTFTQFRIQQEN